MSTANSQDATTVKPVELESAIDPNLSAANPGSYEELHKKTKGLVYL